MNNRNWNSIIVIEWLNNFPSRCISNFPLQQFHSSYADIFNACSTQPLWLDIPIIQYTWKEWFFHFPWGNIYKLTSWLCWIWISSAKYDMRIRYISMYFKHIFLYVYDELFFQSSCWAFMLIMFIPFFPNHLLWISYKMRLNNTFSGVK